MQLAWEHTDFLYASRKIETASHPFDRQIGKTMTLKRRVLIVKCLGTTALAVSLIACTNQATVTPVPPVVNAGSYVFTASGTSSVDGDYWVAGSFVADGSGNITSAVADYNLGSGTDASVALTGTYTLVGNVATITLTNSTKSFTDTFNTVLGNGVSPVSNFDGTGSGTLYPQVTSGFAPAGTYAYTVQGEGDGNITGNGSFVANAAGTFTSGSSTLTSNATTLTAATAVGFLYTPQTGGRGVGSLQGYDLAYYVIGPKQIVALGLDERAILLIPATKS